MIDGIGSLKTVAGTTCVVVIFASLLSSVQSSRSVEGAAVTQQTRLLDRIVRDFAARGEVALGDGAKLAAELVCGPGPIGWGGGCGISGPWFGGSSSFRCWG